MAAPGLGSVALGLHLVLEDHAHESDERGLALAGLAQAATHGHHHSPEATPEHDHKLLDGRTPVLGPKPLLPASLSAPAGWGHPLTERSRPGRIPRGVPPPPLFNIHCSLLL